MSASRENLQLGKDKLIFRDLNAEEEPQVTEIESLCLQCGENGITKLLLTKIPFYKEVVIMSFYCDNCKWKNNELQPASKIQEKGVTYKLKVENSKDLARLVVKTEWASIMIPELEFEIPSQSQGGTVTNIEGIIERACSGINSKLEHLKKEDPDSAAKLEDFLKELTKLRSGDIPFTFILRDCSGNSFLENLCVPLADPQLEVSYFEISREETIMLGIVASSNEESNSKLAETNAQEDLRDEVLDVVIMSTICEVCDYKTTEVKSGSGIEPYGIRATLKIEEHRDLTRDVLKSDTCRIIIKELELDVGSAAFKSRYSTVEGILSTIKEQLTESNPFITGDSADKDRKDKMETLINQIDEIISGQRKVTFIMDDPCGNSHLQSLEGPELDANLTIEKYERTWEQDDELGLLDMKTENYEES
ncbi:hypothetical protein JTE90_026704 [Oedothorax gibbosus]|uniref:Zinc finger ZPR1-type domain-containing protein n=1 Tax=Oedothorax gibbosus TaxID=931172 RepID=A0AAV6V2Q5_9ARAC|nr:hypothetical protein JTE90_026704 [Oedothorax gibbosus]